MAEALPFHPGQTVRVRDDIEEPDPKYVGRTGQVVEYKPAPNLDPAIPWQVLFDDGDIAGFDISELVVSS